MSWSEVSGVEQYLHKDYVVICHFCPNVSLFSIRFLSPKKTFIPSYRASFSLKIIGFKCEGLNFQVFTAEEAFIPLTSWLPAAFLCEGLMFQPFTSVHLQCEYLKIQPFTLKRYENQQETRSVWRSECFFREIKYVCARVRKGVHNTYFAFSNVIDPPRWTFTDTAWSSLHKLPTIFFNSPIRKK